MLWWISTHPPVAAQEPSPIQQGWFEQFGLYAAPMAIMAAICWALFRNYEKALDSERAEKKAAQDELRELNRSARELMIPAVTKATEAIGEAMRVLRKDSP